MAHAGTLSTLALDASSVNRVAGGTLTVDATTGKLTESSISDAGNVGPAVFTSTQISSAAAIGTTGNVFAATVPYISVDLAQQATPLTGYTGGSPCTVSSFCSGVPNGVHLLEETQLDDAASGTLTLMPPVPVRPGSSGLLMLGAGVLVLGSVMRRHRI